MNKKTVSAIFLSLLLATPVFASKESEVRKGNAFYKKGDFDSSLKSYENALKAAPESPEVNFNVGTALYKNEKYAEAVPYLQKGLLSNDPEIMKNAHFNLGDALFGAGLSDEQQNTDAAIKSLEESIRQFNTVMNLDDKDKDAHYNQGIVQKELERLKQKQKQQQQKSGQDQKQDQNQQQQSKPQDQNKQDQDKNSSQSGSDQQNPDQKNSQSNKNDDEQKPPFKPESNGTDDKGDKKSEERKDMQIKPSQGEPNGGEMSKDEAKDLLKQFEQNEQPAGLLDFGKKKSLDHPVLKDW